MLALSCSIPCCIDNLNICSSISQLNISIILVNKIVIRIANTVLPTSTGKPNNSKNNSLFKILAGKKLPLFTIAPDKIL